MGTVISCVGNPNGPIAHAGFRRNVQQDDRVVRHD